MNTVEEIKRINQRELELGIPYTASWHSTYKNSAYIFIGNLHHELTEGDIIVVFSQFGEVVDLNLCRDKRTGKFKGFGFLAYEDQRSTILAIDNLNGCNLVGRTVRVDHAGKYRKPKPSKKSDTKSEDIIDATQPKVEMYGSDDEDEDEYEERRRMIWDYEAYDKYSSAPRSLFDQDTGVSTDRPTGNGDFESFLRDSQATIDTINFIPKSTKRESSLSDNDSKESSSRADRGTESRRRSSREADRSPPQERRYRRHTEERERRSPSPQRSSSRSYRRNSRDRDKDRDRQRKSRERDYYSRDKERDSHSERRKEHRSSRDEYSSRSKSSQYHSRD